MKKTYIIIRCLAVGGLEKSAIQLAKYLREKNHKVCIIQIYETSIKKNILPIHVQELMHQSLLQSKVKYTPISIYKIYKNFANIIQKDHANFNKINIISMGEKENILLIIFKYIMRIYAINVTIISSVRNHPEHKKFSFIVRILRKILYPYTDILHVQTNSIKKWYLNNLNLNPSKIIKIANINEKMSLNKKYCNKNITNDYNILLIGNKWKQKGFKYVVDYANFLDENKYDLSKSIKFHIFGNCQSELKAQKYSEYNNLPNSIILHGLESHQNIFKNKYNLFFLTSLYEGFPNVLIEAIEQEILPIILNYNYGIEEIVGEDYEYLLDNHNLNIFHRNIKKALSLNEIEYKRNISYLQNRLINYSPEKVIKDWLKIL